MKRGDRDDAEGHTCRKMISKSWYESSSVLPEFSGSAVTAIEKMNWIIINEVKPTSTNMFLSDKAYSLGSRS